MECQICKTKPFLGSWTDFHGEQNCMVCGAVYQMKDYSGAPKNQKYPYIDFSKKFKSIFKEYWQSTNQRCRLGRWLGSPPQDVLLEQQNFQEWLKEKHPDWLN